MNLENVRVISNPVVLLNLCTMRDKKTDSQGVRIATRKITRSLLYEASQNLPLVEREITTPITTLSIPPAFSSGWRPPRLPIPM